MHSLLNPNWLDFARLLHLKFEAVSRGEMSIEECSYFLDLSVLPNDEEIREFLVNSIWEVDGFPGIFASLKEAIRNSKSEDDIRRFMLKRSL